MADLITGALVRLDADLGEDNSAVVSQLAQLVEAAGRSTDAATLADDAMVREVASPTGLPGGVALPHCRTAAVSEPVLAFARLSRRVPFGAHDGPAQLVFLIAAPIGGGSDHLTLLSLLARALAKPSFVNSLRQAETADEAASAIASAIGTFTPSTPPATQAAVEASTETAES